MTGSGDLRPDFSHDGSNGHPPHVFRLMLIEYEVLTELLIEPMRADLVPPAIAHAIGNLIRRGLARQNGLDVTLTGKGRGLLGVIPMSQTRFTVAFDYRDLGWGVRFEVGGPEPGGARRNPMAGQLDGSGRPMGPSALSTRVNFGRRSRIRSGSRSAGLEDEVWKLSPAGPSFPTD